MERAMGIEPNAEAWETPIPGYKLGYLQGARSIRAGTEVADNLRNYGARRQTEFILDRVSLFQRVLPG